MTKSKLTFDSLKADPRNPRAIDAESAAGLRASIDRFGDLSGIVLNRRTGFLVAGHQRVEQLRALGAKLEGEAVIHPGTGERFPVRLVDWDEQTAHAALLAANNPGLQGDFTDGIDALLAEIGDFDEALIAELRLDALYDWGDDEAEPPLSSDAEGGGDLPASPSMVDRFGVPPFSVLDARQGYWQDRKRAWIGIGIRSELGRGEHTDAAPGGSPLPATRRGPDGLLGFSAGVRSHYRKPKAGTSTRGGRGE